MNPYLHTALVLLVIAVSFYIGRYKGFYRGIQSTLDHLLHYKVLTLEEIKLANERFQKDRGK